jgi:hypothetical protein
MTLELQIGIGLIAISLLLAILNLVRRLGMVRTNGHVVRSEAMAGKAAPNSPAQSAKLTVRFTDTQGLVRFFSGTISGEMRKPGETIAILFKKSDPQVARIDTLSVWVAPLVVGVLGLFLIVRQVLS